jgi:hypothetical protein
MLILISVVSFGPKKGALSAYAEYWHANFYRTTQLMANAALKPKSCLSSALDEKRLSQSLGMQLQFTIMTSHPTVYVLFGVWLFIFFFGEILLLLVFNFQTLTDLIPSHFFMTTKNHVVFLLDNSNNFLISRIFELILFCTTCSVLFLLNLRTSFTATPFSYHATFNMIATLVACIWWFLS